MLRGAYTGPSLRLKRASDNTEQDIAFGVNGWLDSAAASSFIGSSTAVVVKLYDQSGLGRDLVIGTVTPAAPSFVASETNLTNRPALRFGGGGEHLTTSGGVIASTTGALLAHAVFSSDASQSVANGRVASLRADIDTQDWGSVPSGALLFLNSPTSIGAYRNFTALAAVVALPTATGTVTALTVSTTGVGQIVVNSTTGGTATSGGAFGPGSLRVGQGGDGSDPFSGKESWAGALAEIIITTDPSQRAALAASAKIAFGTP